MGMRDLQLGPRGDHQWGNAGVALACVEALNAVCGLPLPKPEAIGLALAETRVPGRLEQLTLGGGRPSVLLDGAHNPAAARCLARHLSRATRPRRRWWLFAAMGDKDRRSMLEALVPQVDGVLCTAGRTSARFLDPCALKAEVEEVARSLGVSLAVEWAAEPGEAMAWLGEELGAEDEVLVAGSLYLVGDVREDLLGVS